MTATVSALTARSHVLTLGLGEGGVDVSGCFLLHGRHHVAEEGFGEYVEQARVWFESIWTTVAHEPAP